MQFSVESWSPEYGTAADATQMEDTDSSVDVGIERGIADWKPITPSPSVRCPATILFVDGVRRIDASVWITAAHVTRAGVCASVAAGSVLCTPGSAVLHDVEVVRGLFVGPAVAAEAIDIGTHGSYELFPCHGDTPEDLYLGIHQQMTLLEGKIAAEHDVELVVFDGPLRGRNDEHSVGYVKTQHVQYLPTELQPVLGHLQPGQRTPLFLIGGSSMNRYSWYLRLPGPRSQPLSGMVRCELTAIGSVCNAVERADSITATLPRFASEPHKDPRAPQNLYPIAGLEHQLRHRLGDSLFLERVLRRAAGGRPVR